MIIKVDFSEVCGVGGSFLAGFFVGRGCYFKGSSPLLKLTSSCEKMEAEREPPQSHNNGFPALLPFAQRDFVLR